MDIKKIGDELQKNRIKAGLSQKQLYEKSGVAQKTIGDIEAGDANPTIGTLNALADTLGISSFDLLGVPYIKQGPKWKDLSEAASFLSSFSSLSPKIQRFVWAIVYRDPKLVREFPDLSRVLE